MSVRQTCTFLSGGVSLVANLFADLLIVNRFYYKVHSIHGSNQCKVSLVVKKACRQECAIFLMGS
jgi:hypothetical protein